MNKTEKIESLTVFAVPTVPLASFVVLQYVCVAVRQHIDEFLVYQLIQLTGRDL